MGCAWDKVPCFKKSKTFNIEYAEFTARSRGITVEKLYQTLPRLLMAKQSLKEPDYATQLECANYLNFPIAHFFMKPTGKYEKIWICGNGIIACAFCGFAADYYCDYPIGKGRTCDLPLCRDHKKHRQDIGTDIDYCPHHWTNKP